MAASAALLLVIASTTASGRALTGGAAQSGALRIVVIEGEDAVNIVQQRTAVAPVIEVRDRNDQPVAGAIVRFAIQQGRGTFAGARTLSVTTNAAGRAVAAGLTPTGSGALQIGATATFQGQTAIATITQTNVMTAAQAAAASGGASSGGASGTASSGGAAGGGGGGGISGTTIGVVGGAVAGGALVAANALGGEETSEVKTTYRGSFALQSVRNQSSVENGVVIGHCTNQAVAITGTITVTLDERNTGDIEMAWTEATSASGLCPSFAPSFRAEGTVTNAASIDLNNQFTDDFSSPEGTMRQRFSQRFTGALSGEVINGVVTISLDLALIAPVRPSITFSGGYPAASGPVTLTRQ